MTDEGLQRRFSGSVRLVIWHLWRVGETTEIGECLKKAVDAGMINEDDVAFITECLACDKAIEKGCSPTIEITEDVIHSLHMQAIKLNTADSA